MILGHVAGLPVEELLMPFVLTAGAVWVGLRARFGSRNAERGDLS